MQAFAGAWKTACSSSAPVTMLVPEGKSYRLKPIVFSGPCKSTVTVSVSRRTQNTSATWRSYFLNLLASSLSDRLRGPSSPLKRYQTGKERTAGSGCSSTRWTISPLKAAESSTATGRCGGSSPARWTLSR